MKQFTKAIGIIALLAAVPCFGQLDPSIPLRFEMPPPPPQPDILDTYRRVQQIKLQQQQIEENQRQAAELARLAQEERARKKTPIAPAPHVPPPPVVTPVPLVDLDSQKSIGLYNGRHWQWIPADERLTWLDGYAESLTFAVLAWHYKEPPAATFPASSTFKEIAEGLNVIYAAPENARIPIALALGVFQMKVSGAQEVDIAERLRRLREAFALSPAAAAPASGGKDTVGSDAPK